MPMMRAPKTRISQGGFSMIESLVAFVVIVFGILGVAALQAVAVGGTKVAADRSTASIHTSALISRMKGNDTFWQSLPVGSDITISATGVIADIGAGSIGTDLEAESTDCAVTACIPIETASYNLKTWAQNGTSVGVDGGFADRLPAPTARIRRIGNDFPVMLEISLIWNEKRAVSGVAMAGTFYSATGTAQNSQRDFAFIVRARP